MRFYEHEAKALFARHGLPLGKGGLAKTAAERAASPPRSAARSC